MECKRGEVYKAPQRGRGTTSGQMIKSWGAFWALLGLLAIVAFGLWLDLSHGCLAGARRCASAHASNGKIDLSPLLKLGQFLEDHNGAVSAVAAIFLAVFTIVLAWKTAGLNAATRGLQSLRSNTVRRCDPLYRGGRARSRCDGERCCLTRTLMRR